MAKDALKEFVNLRQSLLSERERIEKRLGEINAALGDGGGGEIPLNGRAKKEKPTKAAGARRKKRIQNPMSLRAAIMKVTSEGPKTKKEIFDGVKKLGYRFAGKDPINSINVILYSKPKFKNEDGKFSPGK